MALLLAKGDQFDDWRGVDEFVAAYREAAIKLASARRPAEIASLLGDVRDALEVVAAGNRTFRALPGLLADRLTAVQGQEPLRELLTGFWGQAYHHFRQFAAVPAFFEAANALLHELVGMQVANIRPQFSEGLPPFALLALGPAGRLEYTRFCRVQLALVWEGDGGTDEDRTMEEFSGELGDWLRASGVALDETIMPVQPAWRGSLGQWRERLDSGISRGGSGQLIELLRLADQAVLVDERGLAGRFRALCSEQLHRRTALANLVERSTALSNGLGMMGGFRLNRSGPYRGAFNLLNHALVPLAACVGALCLYHDLVEDGTPRRLRELVRNGRLDVDLGERALQAWQFFSHHRLTLELSASAGHDCRDILNLDLTGMDQNEQEQLRTCLETVSDLQRHLHVSFGQQA